MDIYGDHALHCAKSIGVKFCHDLARDTFVDFYYKASVAAHKEAPTIFLSDNANTMKPTDLLVYNWINGRDV